MEFVQGDVVVRVSSQSTNNPDVGEVVSIDPITRMVRVKWYDDNIYVVKSCKPHQIQLAREYFNK